MKVIKILRLLAPALLLPIVAAIVGNAAYAKGKRAPEAQLDERAKSLDRCMKDAGTELGDSSSIALNEICTCVSTQLPSGAQVDEFLKTETGRQTFGRCLFAAKDGV